jgi:hypothetical protein
VCNCSCRTVPTAFYFGRGAFASCQTAQDACEQGVGCFVTAPSIIGICGAGCGRYLYKCTVPTTWQIPTGDKCLSNIRDVGKRLNVVSVRVRECAD